MNSQNASWKIPDDPNWEQAGVAVLMDIRTELVRLNRLLACPNFINMPRLLRDIKRNTAPRPRRRTPKAKKAR